MNKIVRVFLDTNMSLQHQGLFLLAKSKNVNLNYLGKNEHVVFINKGLNKVKVYSNSRLVSYLRLDDGRKLDLNIISMIPSCFGSDLRIDWDKAEAMSLDRKLKNKPATILRKSSNPSLDGFNPDKVIKVFEKNLK